MSGTDESDPSELADAVFRILSDEYRRCALYYLSERDSATVGELATVLTGWVQAREEAFERTTPADRDRIRARLHHVHLPRIADAGFVRYDHDSGEVALEQVPEVLESLLEQALEEDRRAAESRFDGGTEGESDHGTEEGPDRGIDDGPDRKPEDSTDSETDRDHSEEP